MAKKNRTIPAMYAILRATSDLEGETVVVVDVLLPSFPLTAYALLPSAIVSAMDDMVYLASLKRY